MVNDVTPLKPKRIKHSAPISPLQQSAARLKKLREKLREMEEPRGSKGKGKSKVIGTLESSKQVAMDCSDSLSEEADEDVHSEDESGEFFDTCSDEELADARKKLKAEKLKQKKKHQEVSAGVAPCISEEERVDSDLEDYFRECIKSGIEVEITKSVIRKMISDEELKCQKWTVGMRFVSPDFFKEMVTRYAMLSGYPIVWRRSDKQRKEACCTGDDCSWRIYASWNGSKEAFVIKVVHDVHSCERHAHKNIQVKPVFLAKEYLAKFRCEPDLKRKSLAAEVNAKFGVNLRKSSFYRAQKRAKQMLYGTLEQHYMKIASYLKELKRMEPGATIELLTDSPSEGGSPETFKRLCVSFPATREGFLSSCRPFICLDGTFLKTPVGGVLFAAIGRDGNNQMFPIAWAVAEAETKDAWSWFMQILRRDLPGFGGEDCTIISDQHKGLADAVRDWYPLVEHRNCARHVYPYWPKGLTGKDNLKELYWKAVRAYSESAYQDAIEEMRTKVGQEAVTKFLNKNPTKFCRSKVRVSCKCDTIVNNMAEAFNGTIIEARKKPLIDMLEDIRESAMTRLFSKKQAIESSNYSICPRIRREFDKEKEKVKGYEVLQAAKAKFQITHLLKKYAVDLDTRTCTCRKFDLTGIPCVHAIAACNWMRTPAEQYIDDRYKRAKYYQTWSGEINPLNGEQEWERVMRPILPPEFKSAPGRPKKNRRKAPEERNDRKGTLTRHGLRMTCKLCGEQDHNKRTCPRKDDPPQQ